MFPIIAIAVWPLTILGIVLGVVGLRRSRAGSARNAVAAVCGIVLSVVGLALCVTWLSMYAAAGVGTAQPADGTGRDSSRPPVAGRATVIDVLDDRLLLGPGPSNPYPEAVEALARPVLGHLDPEYLGVVARDRRPAAGGVPHRQPGDAAGQRHRLVPAWRPAWRRLLEPGDTASSG